MDSLGNEPVFIRDRPREEWPMNPDGTLGMFTQPLDVRALLAEARKDEICVAVLLKLSR